MIDHTTILKSHPDLIRLAIDYFTSESTNPDVYNEIKEIGLKMAEKSKNQNAKTFIGMGYLSIFDFLMYLSEKKFVGNGVQIRIVEIILQELVEKLIITPIDDALTQFGAKRFKSNGSYAKHLYERDLIYNLIFGFNYIIEKYWRSVFKIENIDANKDPSIGTGFLIQDEECQFIVTNKHVLEKATKLNILDYDDKPIEFKKPFVAVKADLAIIPIPKILDFPILQLHPIVEILSEIITIGYPSIPMTKFAYQVYHKGEVNSFVEDYYDNKLFLISAKTSSGNSGSPVLNKTGLVIGIITEELFEKDLFQKKGKLPYYAAIPTDEIIRLIESYKNNR